MPPRPGQRRRRWRWIDTALLTLALAGVGYLVYRTNTVFNYRWEWHTVWPFIFRLDAKTGSWVPNILVEGFLTTIRLAVWGILIAGVIGTLMGMARNSRRLFLRLLSQLLDVEAALKRGTDAGDAFRDGFLLCS